MKMIPFSPPDITEAEINEVIGVLKSGWITSGPKKKEFEDMLTSYCGVDRSICLSSATVSMELVLRVLGIGPGDEVITTAYTYTASASVIHHVGAKIVLVDTAPGSFEIDYDKIGDAITEKTKAIISVDLGGRICDYDKIYSVVNSKKHLFSAGNNDVSKALGRIAVIADSSHGLGSKRNGLSSGQFADFTCFSFHAVKNLTTAEGGAAVWKTVKGIDNDYLYKQFMLYSLHGQNKDALDKTKAGAWEYDIVFPGYKCNMTDIQAALGVSQLKRYADMIAHRKALVENYENAFKDILDLRIIHFDGINESNCHLYLATFPITIEQRNEIIELCAQKGVILNVHYKPLPLLTAYKDLGFNIDDYPNSYNIYKSEISFPLYSTLSFEDQKTVIDTFIEVYNSVK
ncbi:MAG: DegT/DnrJ/EryC1/StrS aminotransferase family protein [Clostridia bacterium]|nr:DegT/DnrJ/EryC1/StrS aminotransferase family protein [Clostridia bacterium]